MTNLLLWVLGACVSSAEPPREPTPPVAPAPAPPLRAGPPGARRGARGGRGGGPGPDPDKLGLEPIVLDDPSIGGRREAFVHFPEGDGPHPLVLAFHGGQGNSGDRMAPRLRPLFDKDVIFVFPSGDPDNPDRIGWVGPGMPGATDEMQDVRYVRKLIERIDREHTVDRKRIYAAGFSNGGYMTHTLFCMAGSEFAGFMMVSRSLALPLVERCQDAPPGKVLLMWGTEEGIDQAHTLPIRDAVDFYRRKNGCRENADRRELPDSGDSTRVTHSTYRGCTDGTALETFEIEGGGHHWPGFARDQPDKSRDVDATEELGRFFDL